MTQIQLAISPYRLAEDLLKESIDASVTVEQKKRGGYPTMFCIYCKNERIENEAPCVSCGAPSPLAGETPYRQDETYGQGQRQPSLLLVSYEAGGMQQADYEW